MGTKTGDIKRRILKQRGVELQHLTRRPITHDDLPSIYPKTRLMKYVELKFSSKLEKLIFTGTLRAVSKKLGVDYSTISKWRTIISDAEDREFFKQFP